MELEVRKQYPRSKPLDIKKKAISHLKGEQERLKYVGGKYLTVPIAAVFLTVIINMIMNDKFGPDKSTLVILLIFLVTLSFMFLHPLVQQHSTEKQLYLTTCMIEILDQQIKDAEK